jgi:hypothetical protein
MLESLKEHAQVTHPTILIFLGTTKRIIRIITNTRNRDTYKELYKYLKILPLDSQYQYIPYCYL